MIKMFFGTKRMVCRPLKAKGNNLWQFEELVITSYVAQKFFHFTSIANFLSDLENVDCLPVSVFLRNPVDSSESNSLIGYINGYVYSKEKHELLVECFLDDAHWNSSYFSELLASYLMQCRKLGLYNFKFNVDEDDAELQSFLKSFGASHSRSEDFTNGKRKFFVYRCR